MSGIRDGIGRLAGRLGASGGGLGALSIRVALGATLVVAVIYLTISVALFGIVTRNLTAQIDARLTDSLNRIPEQQPQPPPGGTGFEPPGGGPRFGPELLVWTVQPDGTVINSNTDATLPSDYETVSTPTTVTIGDTEVRITGRAVEDRYVIVGQTMASVTQAQQTLVLGALLIALPLLILVFIGAVVIGRRVGLPIEQARRRQLEFTADASHELRTPLSVIEAETSLALSLDQDAEGYRSAFGRVHRESQRMRRLLDDLLWLARFDAVGRPPDAEPVDLALLTVETADRFTSIAQARHLDLAVDAPPGATIVAPPEWLDRLLSVLLDNACKYAPEGGLVRVAVTRPGGRVRLTVEDSGPGIPPDQQPRIFDRFHRATESTSGAGLGLAIGDAIVQATEGRWTVGSASIGGASLSVSWPSAPPDAGAVTVAAAGGRPVGSARPAAGPVQPTDGAGA